MQYNEFTLSGIAYSSPFISSNCVKQIVWVERQFNGISVMECYPVVFGIGSRRTLSNISVWNSRCS